jgi:nicotinamidase-related amidase
MNIDHIELNQTAILFFDTLKGYWYTPEGSVKEGIKPMVYNAVRVMKGGRAANIPILFAKANHRSDGSTSALLLTDTTMGSQPWPGGEVTISTPHIRENHDTSEVATELDPRPDDYYIPKFRWSAFHQTYLDLALRTRGIDTVIIAGGSTEVGIASTVYSGRDLDYHMIVVRDACTTSHEQRAQDTLMDLIFPRMCRVRTTDQILQMFRGTK